MDQELLFERKSIIDELAQKAQEQATSKINQLLAEAAETASTLVNKAQAEAQAIEEKAFLQGYEFGKTQAIKDNDDELKSLLEEAGLILKAIRREREEALADEEERIYQIITLISRKILNKDLEISKDQALTFITKALAELEHKACVTLTVNPKIAIKLNAIKAELLRDNPELEQLNINPDATFSNGDLVLESNKARLDHRLDTKLDQLLEELSKQ